MWEPHLEVSKVLLGLLDMASEAAKWVPSQKYGLPLTPGRYHTQRARAPITNQCNGKLLKVKIIFLLARRSIILQISFKFWSSSLKS